MRQFRRLAFGLAICAASAFAGTVYDLTFTGAGSDSNWDTTANWTPSSTVGYPANDGTDSYFATVGGANSYAAILDISATVSGLTVGTGSSVSFNALSNLEIGDPTIGTVGTLTNAGTINLYGNGLTLDVSSGSTGVPVPVVNSGNLNLGGGTFTLNDGYQGIPVAMTGGGTINLGGGSILGFYGDEQLSLAGTVQGTGSIGGPQYANSLTLSAGAGNALTLDETLGNTLTLQAGSTLSTAGGNITLLGSSGYAALNNQGTVQIGGSDTFTFKADTGGGPFSIVNDGSINMTGGTLVFDNDGGPGGQFVVGSLAGTGILNMSGTALITSAAGADLTNALGHTVSGTGTIDGTVSFSNAGTVIANGGTLTIANSADYNSVTSTLSGANGTFQAGYQGAQGTLQFGNITGGIVNNSATIVLDGVGSQFQNASGGDALAGYLSNNAGTLTLQNGASLALTAPSFTNSGSVNVLSGSSLDLTGTQFMNVSNGTLSGGAYTVGGTLSYNATSYTGPATPYTGPAITTIDTNTSLALDIGGSILASANNTTIDAISNSLTTNNGTLQLQNSNPDLGTTTLALTTNFTNNGTLNVLANSVLDLTGGTFANVTSGTVNNNPTGVLSVGTYNVGGTIAYNGNAITEIAATTSLTLTGSGALLAFDNLGNSQDALSNSLTINNGTLKLASDSTNGEAILQLGQAFTNNGTLNVGNANGGALLTMTQFTNNGTVNVTTGLNGTGFIQVAQSANSNPVTINNTNTINLNGGLLFGSGAAINSGTINLTNGGALVLDYIDPANIVPSLSNSGNLYVGTNSAVGAVTVFNSSTGTVTLDGTMPGESGGTFEATEGFTNTGTVVIQAGAGVSGGASEPALIVDPGALYVQTGSSALTQVDGILAADETDIDGGTLTGSGWIEGLLVNNGGTVTVGDAAGGTLSACAYTQNSGGNTVFTLGGDTAGSGYSQLNLNAPSYTDDVTCGTATLDGDVEFDFINGYTPDETYELIVGTYTGNFASVSFDNLSGLTAQFSSDANGDLLVDFVTPEPAPFVLMTAGLALIGIIRLKRSQKLR